MTVLDAELGVRVDGWGCMIRTPDTGTVFPWDTLPIRLLKLVENISFLNTNAQHSNKGQIFFYEAHPSKSNSFLVTKQDPIKYKCLPIKKSPNYREQNTLQCCISVIRLFQVCYIKQVLQNKNDRLQFVLGLLNDTYTHRQVFSYLMLPLIRFGWG